MTRQRFALAFASVIVVGGVVVAARSASAAQPSTTGPDGEPIRPAPPASATTTPITPPPPATASPSAAPAPAPAPATTPTPTTTVSPPPSDTAPADADKPMGLLAPRFPEDHYPGEPDEDGVMPGVPLSSTSERSERGASAKREASSKGLRFAMHGYFRAPMRITKAARAGEPQANWRTPNLIDDDYFRSGFAYTPVNETDFTELYLSVGNDKLTGTIQFQGSLYSDAARPIIDRQSGISQGYLTYRFAPDLVPGFKTRFRVKGGAFWDRFGYLPKYDTYVFARTHQMGVQARVDVENGRLAFWLLDGIGTHLEDLPSNEGLTLIHYASVGASWDRTVELGGYFYDATMKEKRQLAPLTDADMTLVGVDARVDSHIAGKLYAATSFLQLTNATFMAPVVEIMHAFGGRGVTENYLGTQSSQNGTGSMWNTGLQYDVSVADEYKAFTGAKSSPLPWNGDITASLFGVYSFVQSKQQSPDPLVNKDDHQFFKYGAEAGYRITEWAGVSLRYDRVVLDTGDSANSFRILSPRLAFFTSFLTHEMLFIQYSRYMYNERIRLRTNQVAGETNPDDHAVKIQAQMSF